MKILMISHEYPPIGGGGATACYFLSREYAQKGHEVTLVTAKYQKELNEEKQENLTIYRVKCLRKRQDKSTFIEMLSFLVAAFGKINQLICKNEYQICQIFFGIPSGPLGYYLKKRHQIPYIVRCGGGDIPGAQKRYAIIYKAVNPFVRLIWKNADALIANSQGLRERAEQFENRYPIQIISNGVDGNFFKINKEKEYKKNFVEILFVSRIIEGKGLQYIIPELPGIEEKVKKKIRLTIVGDGPYRERLEKLTRKIDNNEIVKFEGKKKKEELIEYYSRADIFILPSISEGMPNVVLEAMAMSLPIIMTPCEGSKELIKDNGIIATHEEFAEALCKLCINNELRCQMGERSRVWIEKEFQWSKKADEYIDIMKKYILEE